MSRESLQVLLIEDDDNHAKIISRHLKSLEDESVNLVRSVTLTDGLDQMSQNAFDAVLLDLRLPDSDIDQTLSRTIKQSANIPIIVLSSIEDRSLARRIVHEGAQDYLCKSDLSNELLIRTIYYSIERKRNEATLKRGKEELLAAIQTRDEFLSIASHELKTPLTALQLQLQISNQNLKRNTQPFLAPEVLSGAFATALRQVKSLTNLVDELLDVSRIKTGTFTLFLEDMNLASVSKDILQRYSDQLEKAKCKVEEDLDENIVGHWDHFRIEQIFVNLISNIIKYAPGCSAKISSKRQDGMIVLTVEDDGPGIPEAKQDKLFERFERAASSKNVSGLGLGLYIVKRIVQAHQGSITMESAVGRGTKFTIKLPPKVPQLKVVGGIEEG